MNRPNIVIITTDQQRFDALGAMDNPIIKTPHLDRLAREGALFESAVTPCPLCMPARACLVTGLPASELGILENEIPSGGYQKDSIPTRLHSLGYWCQAIGKMHFSNIPYAQTYGMDNMILSEETRGIRLAKHKKDICLDDYDRFLHENKMWGWDKPPEIGYNEIKPLLNPLPKKFHVTQWCGDQTVSWIENDRPRDKPFFLWSSFVKPHVPYDCPEHLKGLYDNAEFQETWDPDQESKSENPYFASYRKGKEFDLYSKQAKRQALANYYANITFIDEQVGRILDVLEKEGLSEDTLVIFTSDHGDLMGDHGLWYKSFGYEGSLRIPLILRWPGHVTPNARCKEIVSLLDIYPTVLSAAGIVVEETNRKGHNLFSLLDGTESCNFAFSEVMNAPYYMAHVRTKDWKYLFYQNGGFEELYHLTDDPDELLNLVNDSGYEEIKLNLRNQAEKYILFHGDNCNVLDTHKKLKVLPYKDSQESTDRPFSRMPWDTRIPRSLSKMESLFWQNEDWDWLDVLQ
ncbi:sulfatase-like hydrolase/transferase [uncultured Sphaerochaeta sp.]|uniref:sulfatase family protein n=1 Tax=uncultured Sphaerochaeta sp. TaxID=886478 RepID=UPI002A0A8A2C|nr:sulfatase-like hydrolase/transferase [uncultured Sphaerochaeta sp.]